MNQSNENHPLQLRLQGKILCRCYSTDLWGDARGASGEEVQFSISVSTPTAGAEAWQLHPKRGWCSEGCTCLIAAHHLAGAPKTSGDLTVACLAQHGNSASGAFHCLHCSGSLSLVYRVQDSLTCGARQETSLPAGRENPMNLDYMCEEGDCRTQAFIQLDQSPLSLQVEMDSFQIDVVYATVDLQLLI